MNEAHWNAVLEVRYGIHYNAANERLYRRLRLIFDALQIVCGGAAFAAWAASKPEMSAFAGLFIALISALNLLVSPAEMATRFNEVYRAFTELDAVSLEMSEPDIRKAIAKIRSGAPWGVDALGNIAFNRCLAANGYSEGFLETTPWSRFVAFIS